MAIDEGGLLPFILTEQYLQLREICEYARRFRVLGLIYGEAGAGKTKAAQRYVREQPLITANGQSSVLYFQLAQSDKTDRAFLNALVAAITGLPQKNLTAAVAMAEAQRLLQKYRYVAIIVDEVGFLQESGLEAIRTLHDQTTLPIILITMPNLVDKLERYPQFYSRISQFLCFESLTKADIRHKVLPNVALRSHISFDPQQEDASEIVAALYKAAGGTKGQRASFRDVVHILQQANELLQIESERRALEDNPDEQPPMSPFDAAFIDLAATFAKRRGTRARTEDDDDGDDGDEGEAA